MRTGPARSPGRRAAVVGIVRVLLVPDCHVADLCPEPLKGVSELPAFVSRIHDKTAIYKVF
jgi:hypothetical protein